VDDAGTLPPPGGAIDLPEPTMPVVRDLPDIQREGILRLITCPGPTRCMIFRGEDTGFEVELARAFAGNLNLRLEVVLPGPGEDPLTLLAEGAGDLVAGGRPAVNSWKRYGAWSYNYAHTRGVVAVQADPAGAPTITSLDGVTVHVPAWSPLLPALRRLRDGGTDLLLVKEPPDVTEELLLLRLARGEIPAVATTDLSLRAARAVTGRVTVGAVLTDIMPVGWLLRANAPQLRDAVDRFLRRHYRMGVEGPRRSQSLGTLMARYFEDPAQVRYYRQASLRPDRCGRISPWDDIIRRECLGTELDWLLVAALIQQESHFDPTARSDAGAVGLMQVLPRFADADTTALLDPEVNIREGVRQLTSLYRGYAYLDSTDRLAFTIATYHAGRGHMNDARRLAMDLGLDPNRWEGNVVVGLRRKRDRASYRSTRYGYYRGDETVRYTETILYRWRLYRRFLSLYHGDD